MALNSGKKGHSFDLLRQKLWYHSEESCLALKEIKKNHPCYSGTQPIKAHIFNPSNNMKFEMKDRNCFLKQRGCSKTENQGTYQKKKYWESRPPKKSFMQKNEAVPNHDCIRCYLSLLWGRRKIQTIQVQILNSIDLIPNQTRIRKQPIHMGTVTNFVHFNCSPTKIKFLNLNYVDLIPN